jgi:hypothetical protein
MNRSIPFCCALVKGGLSLLPPHRCQVEAQVLGCIHCVTSASGLSCLICAKPSRSNARIASSPETRLSLGIRRLKGG